MVSYEKSSPKKAAHQKGSGKVFSISEKTDFVFYAAYRHSKYVHILKLTLPLIALIIIGIFSWFTFFSTPKIPNVVILNSDLSKDGRMTMTQPKVEGYTKTKQFYSLKAGRAMQEVSENGLIELQDIVAEVPLAQRGSAIVKALSGFYDNVNGRLRFDKPFTVITTDNMVAKFKSADINIETSQINTNEPIDIQRDGQHLTANGMQVKENGAIIVFHGNVRLLIDNQTTQ